MKRACLFVGIVAVTGCTLSHRHLSEPGPQLPGNAVVFVADGAGDFRAASTSFRNALGGCAPAQVQTISWSHGFLRILRDQLDYAHGRVEGHRLAARIMALKEAYPDTQVYLVGHSAGTVVVVAAAEALPPGSIEGMALLAPSLSTFYDLRPALRSIRHHLDVYYSRNDWGYLGIGTALFGTSDRQRSSASGRIGFQVYVDTAGDAEIGKLRQHGWQTADRVTGNSGGHYGSYQPGFLRARVLPLLFDSEMQVGNDPISTARPSRPYPSPEPWSLQVPVPAQE